MQSKGCGVVLKVGACILVALSIISIGLYDCIKVKKTTHLLEEIVDFIGLLKNEINYKKASYPDLMCIGKKQDYTYILFDKHKPEVSDINPDLSKEFLRFTEQIGTTDEQGQIAICNDYSEKFSRYLKNQRSKETSRLQVNLSLSILGALSVIIIFI